MDRERRDLRLPKDPRGAPGRGRAGQPQAGGAADEGAGHRRRDAQARQDGHDEEGRSGQARAGSGEPGLFGQGPDQLWVADITQVRTWSGWLYLAVVLDAWSRRIVGWAMATRMPAELVGDALTMAVTCRQPKGPVVHHSVQGSQYTSLAFGQRVPGGGRGAVDGLGG